MTCLIWQCYCWDKLEVAFFVDAFSLTGPIQKLRKPWKGVETAHKRKLNEQIKNIGKMKDKTSPVVQ